MMALQSSHHCICNSSHLGTRHQNGICRLHSRSLLGLPGQMVYIALQPAYGDDVPGFCRHQSIEACLMSYVPALLCTRRPSLPALQQQSQALTGCLLASSRMRVLMPS